MTAGGSGGTLIGTGGAGLGLLIFGGSATEPCAAGESISPKPRIRTRRGLNIARPLRADHKRIIVNRGCRATDYRRTARLFDQRR